MYMAIPSMRSRSGLKDNEKASGQKMPRNRQKNADKRAEICRGWGGQCQKMALVAAPLEEESHELLVWEKHPEKGPWRRKNKSSKFFSGTCVGAVQEGLIAHG
jgi:hypothetical protein